MRVWSFLFLALVAVTDEKPRLPVDSEKQKEELLEHHRKDRRAHFENNAALALSDQVEEGFIYVRNGAIARRNKADFRPMLETYFKNAKYYEWDDLEPPIIRVSDDGSMAWMIERIRVRRTQPSLSGAAKEEKFVYAGITTYERLDGKWLKVANVSTFEQGPDTKG